MQLGVNIFELKLGSLIGLETIGNTRCLEMHLQLFVCIIFGERKRDENVLFGRSECPR